MTVFRCCCRIEMEIWRRFLFVTAVFFAPIQLKIPFRPNQKSRTQKQINGIKFLIKPFYLCFCAFFFCTVFQQKLLKSDRNYVTRNSTTLLMTAMFGARDLTAFTQRHHEITKNGAMTNDGPSGCPSRSTYWADYIRSLFAITRFEIRLNVPKPITTGCHYLPSIGWSVQ